MIVIDASARIVMVHLHGTIRLGDFLQGRASVSAMPGWSPSFTHVMDFTDVTSVELSHEDIKKLATATPIFDRGALQIIVARPGSVVFGLARMFEIYADGQRRVHVVDSIDHARALAAAHQP